MADFGFLSDTDDSAVDELISQTQELCILEQISKINCSGFTESVLPTDLETRFHKLKSFPLSKSKTPTTNKSLSKSNTDLSNISVKGKKDDGGSLSDSKKGENFSGEKQDPGGRKGSLKGEEVFVDNKEYPEEKLGLKNELKSGYVSSSPSKSSMEEEIFTPKKENPDGKGGFKKKSLNGSDYSNSWVEDVIFSASKQKSEKKMSLKSKSKSGSSNSSNSFMDSPSPKTSGCFWCSPKRVTKKQSKANSILDRGENNVDEFLSDLSTFSVKEQQKRLKKAMKEQEKMSKEAEKIVKWAKQASARMSFHGIDDELSEDEIAK